MKKELIILKNNDIKVIFTLDDFPNVNLLKQIQAEVKLIEKKVEEFESSRKVTYEVRCNQDINIVFYKKLIVLVIASLKKHDGTILRTKKLNFDYKSKTIGFRVDSIYLTTLKKVKKYIEKTFNAFGAKINVKWINEPDIIIQDEIKRINEEKTNFVYKEAQKAKAKDTTRKSNYQSANVLSDPISIKKVKSMKNNSKVCFFGQIQTITERKHLSIIVEDDEDHIKVMTFKPEHKDQVKVFEAGSAVKIYGSLMRNDSKKDLLVWFLNIERASIGDVFVEEQDNSIDKRFELHTHTKMSALDGVCNIKDYYERLKSFGHKGMAITDHDSVQAFSEVVPFQNIDKDFKFIFGAEISSIEPTIKSLPSITSNVDDSVFVIYDLETTGLHPRVDEIIEISMRKIDINGSEVEEPLHFFLKTQNEPSESTLEFTGITEDNLMDGLEKKEAAKEIHKYITSSNNTILVAHNATFDNGFLKVFLKQQLNYDLNLGTIDTLSLAREITDLKSFALGKLSKALKISYDAKSAHRADYDTDILAKVFLVLLNEIKSKERNLIDVIESSKLNLINWDKRHLIVLSKNLKGKERLYELISMGQTKYFLRGPSVPFEEIEKNREDILLGSSCSSGFAFQAALKGDFELMKNWISKMDYIEVQPLDSYSHLLGESNLSKEDLKEIIFEIVKEAKKQEKIIVATSNSHYLFDREKFLRDVYINTEGIKGAKHPYFRTLKTRLNPDALVDGPNQVYMSTDKMLKEMEFLSDIVDINEIVITNSNLIANKCENYNIQPSGVYPPVVEDEDVNDWVEKETYKKAKELYGEHIPDFINLRLKKELRLLKENDFNVIYYISAKLVRKVESGGALVGSRGSVGSSLVAHFIGITEVNPMKPHYHCKDCGISEEAPLGFANVCYDLEEKECKSCKTNMRKFGTEIPFETFLGLDGDKTPDIDLNIPSELQIESHDFIREMLGEENTFRAGTISTVADRTAYAILSKYNDRLPKEKKISRGDIGIMCNKLVGVKRTTGKHPGGIIVVPKNMNINYFTPYQYPGNSKDDSWHTTHLDFHFLHDNILKFDLLGHKDPSALIISGKLSGVNPISIDCSDQEIVKLFTDCEVMKIKPNSINGETTGSIGLPEFGTKKTREITRGYKPKSFADLIRISGISHGEGIWKDNIEKLLKTNVNVTDLVTCRDDIMNYLKRHNVDDKSSFTIMESIRKGKGISENQLEILNRHKIPQFYIKMCKSIGYLFPKAHAVAYVLMAYRTAYYKLKHPLAFYASYFSTKCKQFPVLESQLDSSEIIKEYQILDKNSRDLNDLDRKKYIAMEVVMEAIARGIKFDLPNINLAEAMSYIPVKNSNSVMLPFSALDGFQEVASNKICAARREMPFESEEDLKKRARLNTKQMSILKKSGLLEDLNN